MSFLPAIARFDALCEAGLGLVPDTLPPAPGTDGALPTPHPQPSRGPSSPPTSPCRPRPSVDTRPHGRGISVHDPQPNEERSMPYKATNPCATCGTPTYPNGYCRKCGRYMPTNLRGKAVEHDAVEHFRKPVGRRIARGFSMMSGGDYYEQE